MTPMKFKIQNENHSKKIQEWLICNDYFWPGDINKPFHTESQFLFTDFDGCISHGNSVELFKEYKGEEIVLS